MTPYLRPNDSKTESCGPCQYILIYLNQLPDNWKMDKLYPYVTVKVSCWLFYMLKIYGNLTRKRKPWQFMVLMMNPNTLVSLPYIMTHTPGILGVKSKDFTLPCISTLPNSDFPLLKPIDCLLKRAGEMSLVFIPKKHCTVPIRK